MSPLRVLKARGYRGMLVGQGQLRRDFWTEKLCQEGAKSWGGWVWRLISEGERGA